MIKITIDFFLKINARPKTGENRNWIYPPA